MGEMFRSLARPFVEGMARGFDLVGAYNHRSPYASLSPGEADHRAFLNDWEAIGADLRVAIVELEEREAGCRAFD